MISSVIANDASMVELLRLVPVQRSFVALVVAALFLPIIGVLILGMEIPTTRFAMMHVALLGIAVGSWLGLDPMLLGLTLCGLAGGLLAPLAKRPGGLNGPMGLLMTLGIAGALLVLSVSGVNANGAFELLWGSILATRTSDLGVLALLAIVTLTLLAVKRRQLALLLFDREIAACSGVAVGALTTFVLVLVSISIASSIRLTGALLVDSVTILPALAARNLARSFTSMLAWAVAVGLVGNLLGLLLALSLDQPPGPVLVASTGALTVLTYVIPERTT